MVKTHKQLLKGVSVEKFSNCIGSDGESDSSSDEQAIVTTPLQRSEKNKYTNWNVPTIIEELRRRSLCYLYKRGDKSKLVKRLEQDDAGIQAVQRLDPQTAISGLAGIPRSLAQTLDNGGNVIIVSQMQSPSYNTRFRKRLDSDLPNVKKILPISLRFGRCVLFIGTKP